jgi:hypothetical protein
MGIQSIEYRALPMCRRGMVLLRSPLDWNGPKRLRDLGLTAYGITRLPLVAAFTFAPPFPPQLRALLFGTALRHRDAARGGRDPWPKSRTRSNWTRVLSGKVTYVIARLKMAAGTRALMLLAMGLAL